MIYENKEDGFVICSKMKTVQITALSHNRLLFS